MLDVLFWSLFSLMLLIVIPDLRQARREIAKRRQKYAESPEGRALAATIRAYQQQRTERSQENAHRHYPG